jgi:predicted nucleic acid-binding protein
VTSETAPVVVDTNILFSALLRPGNSFIATLTSERRFYVSESVLAEIFRHKEKIVSATRLDQDALARAYHAILMIVELYREGLIPTACWEQAAELCRGVDPNDAAPVALTLALDGVLWTGDKALKAGLMAKGFDRFFTP